LRTLRRLSAGLLYPHGQVNFHVATLRLRHFAWLWLPLQDVAAEIREAQNQGLLTAEGTVLPEAAAECEALAAPPAVGLAQQVETMNLIDFGEEDEQPLMSSKAAPEDPFATLASVVPAGAGVAASGPIAGAAGQASTGDPFAASGAVPDPFALDGTPSWGLQSGANGMGAFGASMGSPPTGGDTPPVALGTEYGVVSPLTSQSPFVAQGRQQVEPLQQAVPASSAPGQLPIGAAPGSGSYQPTVAYAVVPPAQLHGAIQPQMQPYGALGGMAGGYMAQATAPPSMAYPSAGMPHGGVQQAASSTPINPFAAPAAMMPTSGPSSPPAVTSPNNPFSPSNPFALRVVHEATAPQPQPGVDAEFDRLFGCEAIGCCKQRYRMCG
jgi:hypothetical protein